METSSKEVVESEKLDGTDQVVEKEVASV